MNGQYVAVVSKNKFFVAVIPNFSVAVILNFSRPQFPQLYNGANNSCLLGYF